MNRYQLCPIIPVLLLFSGCIQHAEIVISRISQEAEMEEVRKKMEGDIDQKSQIKPEVYLYQNKTDLPIVRPDSGMEYFILVAPPPADFYSDMPVLGWDGLKR